MHSNLALWLTFMSALIIGISATAVYYQQRIHRLKEIHQDRLETVEQLSFHDGMDRMSRWIAEDTVAGIEKKLDLRK